MISRVADHCFWLGRYLERPRAWPVFSGDQEPGARRGPEPAPRLAPGDHRLRGGGALPRPARRRRRRREQVQAYLAWDEQNPCSIRRCLAAARDNARSIREVVSLETWEALNALHLWVGSPGRAPEWREDRHAFYRRIRTSAQSLHGIVRGTMLHDDALHFLELGMMLERAGQTARHPRRPPPRLPPAGSPRRGGDGPVALAAGGPAPGSSPFMKLHRGRSWRTPVARFLVLEPLFPRSVRFALDVAAIRLSRIRPAAEEELPGGEAQLRLVRFAAWVAGR